MLRVIEEGKVLIKEHGEHGKGDTGKGAWRALC